MTCAEFRAELLRSGKTPDRIGVCARHAATCRPCMRHLKWVCVSHSVLFALVLVVLFGLVGGLIYLAFGGWFL